MRVALSLGLAGFAALCCCSTASAARAAPAPDMRTLETIVVSGVRPGPALWKVSNGDNTLWILGTVSPVPAEMEWYSPQSEAVLRQTREIIGRPGAGAVVKLSSALKVAFAMPTILKARKNPDGKTLREVLPADLYARWSQLRSQYLPRDKSIEQWRPSFAAGKLYSAAIEQAGLRSGTGAGERIGKLAKEYKITQTPTQITVTITDPKGLAKSMNKTDMDDVACFRSVLDRLERDVAHATQTANAWAVGDIPELRRLVGGNRPDSCLEAFAKVEAIQSTGLLDARQRSEEKWLAAAAAALENNDTSFATLPASEMFDAAGLLARLGAKGYAIVIPE